MQLSAGCVVVRNEARNGTGEWRYLFLRAYRNWDFPKGTVEKDEDPMRCARREVQEETGITDLQFEWGGVYRETEPYRSGKKIARYYLARTEQRELTLPVSPELGRPEHHEYRWVTGDELLRLAPERLLPVVQWAREVIEGTGL
jgi:8-oxo-dGTP pyrophosphatase MutT (NUDIX family)